jgi:hypothetical protein
MQLDCSQKVYIHDVLVILQLILIFDEGLIGKVHQLIKFVLLARRLPVLQPDNFSDKSRFFPELKKQLLKSLIQPLKVLVHDEFGGFILWIFL